MSIGERLKRFTRRASGDPVQRDLNPYRATLEAVKAMARQLQSASDSRLQERAQVLKKRAGAGVPLEQLLIEVFALVGEVAHRTIGLRPFDVQIVGGIGLHEGKIVEMQTGEGKTLVAVAPAVLNAFVGKGVHVLTFNDYLARRDAEWMGPIYRFMGLTTSFIQEGMSRSDRRLRYGADVTYATAKEAGFDYLRDGLVYEPTEVVQRSFHMALIDEADSILIDEARIPLVIAASVEPEDERRGEVRDVIRKLEPRIHFTTDEYQRNVYLTEEGIERVETLLGCGDLHAPGNFPLLTEVNVALHAEILMRRDVDYIVRHGRVEIVDEFTGRVVVDRHWPDGLQAAIEKKEHLHHTKEGRVLGSITLQHFLRQYPYLCGMTATAESAVDELFEFYGLKVLVVPPNRPCIRTDHPDLIFTHREAKRRALLAEIERVHSTGRPILVGTLSVKESEGLAADLRVAGIGCSVLNAKRDDEEARIVAKAGALGAVTISTNMAGRGTDIRLGGHDGRDHEQVAALGGLYVIGTNRHESRRIDDQLRGRAGRQGDPGSSRFFISLEDDLLVRYGIDDLLPGRSRPSAQLEPVDNPALCREVARTQRIVEGQNFDVRRTLWRYSHFIEQQRSIIYEQRCSVLTGLSAAKTLQERVPEARGRARRLIGEAALQDLERRLMLQAIDECWSEHLATVTEIRDGIHLAEAGGLDPLDEFHKQAAESFDHAMNSIDARVVDRFTSLEITSDRVDMENLELRGPSSTWTYLVNDNAFTDRLAATLVTGRSTGFAAGAALTGPFLMLWALLSRRLHRRGRH
jgi:preprotein translocase subunit SecA